MTHSRLTRQLWLAALVAGVAAPAAAQTMDGSLVGDESFYGPALFVQDTRTQFGDANNPDALLAGGGSEIDQVFAAVSGGRLHVLIAGNLEDNFNKLQIFIDSDAATGVNTIDGANLPPAVDGFCCGGLPTSQNGANVAGEGAFQRMDGLTFDTGFTADYSLIVTHGGESLPNVVDFYAASAHFADLTQGASGQAGGLGMQLAPRGLPQVLRSTAPPLGDYNEDGAVDAADYTLWRDNQGAPAGTLPNDDTGADPIDLPQYTLWAGNFGGVGVQDGFDGFAFKPEGNPGNTEALLGPALPGLSQGELIDRNYAESANGGCTPGGDDGGAGCLVRELEFALPVDTSEAGTNASNHRNFNNFVDLELAIDNSNTAGVIGPVDLDPGPAEDLDFAVGSNVPMDVAAEDPTAVVTGVEFSIPLTEIGSPTGDIRLMAFINGSSHDFISNQITGGNPGNLGFGIGRGNLGNGFFNDGPDPPLFTLDNLPGDQFVTISQPLAVGVPEPTAVLLAGLAAVGLAARRRG
ncbi:MAG: PEP-CTERM sorting domain-containing protein [Planctomycetota bacterium]